MSLPIRLGGCCNRDWRVTWTFAAVESGNVLAEVSNGWAHNSTKEERALLLQAGKLKEAFDAPVDGVNLGGPTGGRRFLAQSRVYGPGVRYLRMQVTTTPPAVPLAESEQIEGYDHGPHLFLRVMELPFSTGDGVTANGLRAVALEYLPGISEEGFQCYKFTGPEILFTPNANVLGIVTNVSGQTVRVAATAAAVVVAGAGYDVGDVLELSGGSGIETSQVTVESVDGAGGVTGVSITRGGLYDAVGFPANPVGSTGGAGAGATFNVTWAYVEDFSTAHSSGEILKPRGEPAKWGATWIVRPMVDAIIAFRTAPAGTVLYEWAIEPRSRVDPQHKQAFWFPEESTVGAARNRDPGATVFMTDSDIFMEPVFVQKGWDLRVETAPVDGDSLLINGVARTWRESVATPATEIECLAFDPNDGASLLAALTAAQVNLHAHLVSYPAISSERWTFIQVSGSRWVWIQTYLGRGAEFPLVMAVTGSWGTVAEKSLGRELDWRPELNANNKISSDSVIDADGERQLNNLDTIRRVDWMAIPLSADFDEVVAMPAFSRPFVVQAFFGSTEFDNPAPELTTVELEVTPASAPEGEG